MINKMFINLPVEDLDRSIRFFKGIGFRFNKRLTTDNAVCMVVTDDIYVMLFNEEAFRAFSRKKIADTSKSSEVIISFAVEKSEEIKMLMDKAIDCGAEPMLPYDRGWMKGWGFIDPDGHQWDIFHLDETRVPVSKEGKYENSMFENLMLWYK